MLTAAVCGEIFASPSVLNILSGITAVAKSDASILLIVTNYTGDRLNFGLAGEIAKTKYGYNVETLLIDDDCAIENVRRSVGKRGLAGTILIHKIAGAMAAKGLNLEQIHGFCSEILKNERLATVGFTFTNTGDRIKLIEIGRGVHGEPGIMKIDDEPNFENIVEIVFQKLLKKVPSKVNCARKPKILLMFNNLGGASVFTMATFSNSFLKRAIVHYDIRLMLEGTFVTSLKEEGISVTILHLLDEDQDVIIEYIKHPVKIAANVPFNVIREFTVPDDQARITCYDSKYDVEKIDYDQRFYQIQYDESGKETCRRALVCACTKLIQCEELLNVMDTEFGDGDTGTLASTGAKNILQALNSGKINVAHPAVMLHDLSDILQKNMGGSLGALLCIFLQAAAAAAITSNEDGLQSGDIQFWLTAIKLGMSAVQKYGLADLGDRTMLDALQCGVEQLEKDINENSSIDKTIDDFVAACEQGADDTKEMIPKSGRAAYVFSEGKEFKAEGNDPGMEIIYFEMPDKNNLYISGAQVIAIIARALLEGLKTV